MHLFDTFTRSPSYSAKQSSGRLVDNWLRISLRFEARRNLAEFNARMTKLEQEEQGGGGATETKVAAAPAGNRQLDNQQRPTGTQSRSIPNGSFRVPVRSEQAQLSQVNPTENRGRKTKNAVTNGSRFGALPCFRPRTLRRLKSEWTRSLRRCGPGKRLEKLILANSVCASWMIDRTARVQTARLDSLIDGEPARAIEQIFSLGKRLFF